MDDAQLRTVWQQRQFDDRIAHISQPLAVLTQRVLAKRFRQLRDLSAIWDEIIPDSITEHTALEGFQRGVLTVVVDSAAHRYQLRVLLDGGLMHEMQARFHGGALNKVRLEPGQFCSVDLGGRPRYEFGLPRS